MATSVQPKFGYPGLRISYTCNSAVTAGQLVERVTGTRLVQAAGVGSVRWCGVAQFDVPASRAFEGGPQVGDGNELVVLRFCVVKVQASGAIVAGDPLIAAATGKVSVAGAAPDARFIVGQAFEDAADTAFFNAVIF
jgi:hypothetical protein